MVKRLSTMRETWVPSLDWEDLLEKEMAIHSSTIARKILWMENPPGQRSLTVYSPWGLKESATTEQQSTATPTFSLEHVHASDHDSHRIATSG